MNWIIKFGSITIYYLLDENCRIAKPSGTKSDERGPAAQESVRPKPDIMVQTHYGTDLFWYIGNSQVIISEFCNCEVKI